MSRGRVPTAPAHRLAVLACLLATAAVGAAAAPPMTEPLDLAALAERLAPVQEHIAAGRWPEAAAGLRAYAEAPDFNAHVGLSLVDDILPHEALLDVADTLLQRCLAANTLDNLAMLGPASVSEAKRAMDAARAHSGLSLIYLKRGQAQAADREMDRALAQLAPPLQPTPEDWLRAGLVDHAAGRSERAWERIARAIELDTAVEDRDPFYVAALAPIVAGRTDGDAEVAGYLAVWRREHAPVAPDLALRGVDGSVFRLSDLRGRTVLINFFNPGCGSCQAEVPAVRDIWVGSLQNPRVEVLFLLNQPRQRSAVKRMFARAGIDTTAVVTLAEGSAYDHIPGEPTVWIVDAGGRLRARHSGYREGDEVRYARELSDIAAPARACCGG